MLTDKQLQFLNNSLTDQFNLHQEGMKHFLDNLFDQQKEERQLLLNLTILSGAIAAFTIPLVSQFDGISLTLLVIALSFLFIVIIFGFLLLSFQLNEQMKLQLQGYKSISDSYKKIKDQILKALKNQSMTEYLEFAKSVQNRSEKKKIRTSSFDFHHKFKIVIYGTFALALVMIFFSVFLHIFWQPKNLFCV